MLPLSGFDQLSPVERIQLVQDMWDRIAAQPEQVPVTEAQRAELDRRLEQHRVTPVDCADWAEVKARLRSG